MASRLWKITTRRGIAYVEGRESAERVMAASGRAVGVLKRNATLEAQLDGALAVYADPKGRPFAWLIPFDVAKWEAVLAAAEMASV